jgi:C-1 hydroxylase
MLNFHNTLKSRKGIEFVGDFLTLEENKTFVRRFIEAYNDRNLNYLTSIDDFVSPDYIDHSNKVNREGLKQLFIEGLKAFPDWHENIEDIIAEGDKVWVRLSYTGTHRGEFMGISPTGKKITSKAVDIYRIVDGKLAEYWNVTDNVSIFKQVGAIEVTEKGKHLFPDER